MFNFFFFFFKLLGLPMLNMKKKKIIKFFKRLKFKDFKMKSLRIEIEDKDKKSKKKIFYSYFWKKIESSNSVLVF